MQRIRVLFMGTPIFGKLVCAQLLRTEGIDVVGIVAQPDAPSGRSQRVQASAVAELARAHGVALWQPRCLRSVPDDFPESDVIVTAAYGMLLPKALLSRPVLGCINAHASLLPAYRGASPIQHALFDGCTHTGVTIMHMTERMDAGDIICTQAIPIEHTHNVQTLTVDLGVLAARMMQDAIFALAQGRATRTPQDESKATYAPKLTRADERVHFAEHTAIVLTRRLRAFAPVPGLYTTWNSKTLKIYAGHCIEGAADASMVPGTVVAIGTSGIDIATADRTLWRVTELQREGKMRMTVDQFVRGTSMRVGDVLGCSDG